MARKWIFSKYGKSVSRLVTQNYDGYDFVNENGDGFWLDNADALALANAIYDDQGLGWLPYPENEPEESCDYLITADDGFIYKDTWDNGQWRSLPVIAFRPLPEPYKEV